MVYPGWFPTQIDTANTKRKAGIVPIEDMASVGLAYAMLALVEK